MFDLYDLLRRTTSREEQEKINIGEDILTIRKDEKINNNFFGFTGVKKKDYKLLENKFKKK